MGKQTPTRREFLKAAGATSAVMAAPIIIPSSALGDDSVDAASERIVMGGIGIGNMGRGDQKNFLNSRRRAVRRRVRREEGASATAPRANRIRSTATPTAPPTTTSASCSPATTSTPCTVPRPTTGTRSS
jgi:hypothetical protein